MVGAKLAQWKKEGKYSGKFSALHHFLVMKDVVLLLQTLMQTIAMHLELAQHCLSQAVKLVTWQSLRTQQLEQMSGKAGGVPITMMMNMERRNGENEACYS